MDRPMKASPGTKASSVFCALFAGTGLVALAAFGADAVFPALFGAALMAGPLAVIAYVVFLRSEDREKEESV